MKRSWLVQRLQKPYPQDSILGADNPFAFGGGYRNGGLSDEAMGLLRSCFSFDYMGAAEFEFGAVPKALGAMAADAKHLTAFAHEVDGIPVYVLCRAGHRDEVCERITEWGTNNYADMKEQPGLYRALHPKDEWDSSVCGWLELDNGFVFFTDPEMWKATADLFGVRAGVQA